MPSIMDRLQHAWNAFSHPEENRSYLSYGSVYSTRPDRVRLTRGNERSIVTSLYNRIALDVAAIDIKHIKLDKDGKYTDTVDSSLNERLTVDANVDQTCRAFVQDVVMSMFDEGSVAICPIDTDTDPEETNSFKIHSWRTGKIVEWMPRHVKVRCYNDRTGQKEELIFPKHMVAIIENPLYAIMNEPNSTLQRLIRKLNLLDAIDEQSGSGKLDLIIKLPYVVKSENRRQQAETRRRDIEMQLAGSKYGIAYTDSTESITQLNRPVENNLMKQIEYLTSMLYGQLGITTTILDGSADEQTMINYYYRTVEPIVAAIVDELNRKFITKTARSQGHKIFYFRDPFKLVPVSAIADIADKFTRNEIMSPNEIRQIVGRRPSENEKADELRNRNINAAEGQEFASADEANLASTNGEIQNG